MESYDSVVEKVLNKILNEIEGQKYIQERIDILRQTTLNWFSAIGPNANDPVNLLKFWTLLGKYSVEHFIGLLTNNTRTYQIGEQTTPAHIRLENKLLKDTKRPHHWPLLPIKLLRLPIKLLRLFLKHKIVERVLKRLPFGSKLLRLFRKHKIVERVLKRLPFGSKLLRLFPKPKITSNQLAILKHLDVEHTNQIEPIRGRICYVLHNSLPYASGGYAVRAHGFALGLIQNGFEVLAVTRPGFPHDTMDIDFADVTDSDIDSVKYSRITFPTRKGLSTATYMEGTIARLEERFREIRPSIVIAASFYITALPAIIAARRLGIPVIYEVRGLAEITRLSRYNSYEGSNGLYYARQDGN